MHHHHTPLRNKEFWVLEEVERGQSYFRNQDTVCLIQVARTSAVAAAAAVERNRVGEANPNWEEIPSRPMATEKMATLGKGEEQHMKA